MKKEFEIITAQLANNIFDLLEFKDLMNLFITNKMYFINKYVFSLSIDLSKIKYKNLGVEEKLIKFILSKCPNIYKLNILVNLDYKYVLSVSKLSVIKPFVLEKQPYKSIIFNYINDLESDSNKEITWNNKSKSFIIDLFNDIMEFSYLNNILTILINYKK
jgi:hypothetical protein